MRWLGHVCRMEDGCIPKDLLYGELVTGKRPTGCPQLPYKDTCKRDLKVLGMNTDTWEAAAADRSTWKQKVHKGLSPKARAHPNMCIRITCAYQLQGFIFLQKQFNLRFYDKIQHSYHFV